MLTNHCMYLQWYLELLRGSWGFDSPREHYRILEESVQIRYIQSSLDGFFV